MFNSVVLFVTPSIWMFLSTPAGVFFMIVVAILLFIIIGLFIFLIGCEKTKIDKKLLLSHLQTDSSYKNFLFTKIDNYS